MSDKFMKYDTNRKIDPETLEKWVDFTGPIFTDGRTIRCICGTVHPISKHKRTAKKFIRCPNFSIEVKAASFNHLVDRWIMKQVPIIEAIKAAKKIEEEKEKEETTVV